MSLKGRNEWGNRGKSVIQRKTGLRGVIISDYGPIVRIAYNEGQEAVWYIREWVVQGSPASKKITPI